MAGRSWSGKVALVTGSAQGIGRATAEVLKARGAKVVLADVQAEVLARTAEALNMPAFRLDVTDPDAWSAVVAEIEDDIGPIEILVNNAGIMRLGPFLANDPDRDDVQLEVNVRGVMHGMRAVLPRMRARGRGHVVNIASTAGRVGTPYAAVYSASKHAVIGVTEAVRQELIDSGVQLSYVCPTPVRTALLTGARELAWPKPIAPEDVAHGVMRCLDRGLVEVYVPRSGRLAAVLPAILPRRVYERIGRLLGVDRIFAEADHAARARYEATYAEAAGGETVG